MRTPTLHHDHKIDRLREIPLFSDADKHALEHLASAADEVALGAGRQLITQGESHNEGYVIVSGSADVFVNDDKVANIGAGQLIGELSLFGYGPASATIITAEDTVVLSIPYNRFDQILDDNPQLTRAMARALAGRLHAMDVAHGS